MMRRTEYGTTFTIGNISLCQCLLLRAIIWGTLLVNQPSPATLHILADFSDISNCHTHQQNLASANTVTESLHGMLFTIQYKRQSTYTRHVPVSGRLGNLVNHAQGPALTWGGSGTVSVWLRQPSCYQYCCKSYSQPAFRTGQKLKNELYVYKHMHRATHDRTHYQRFITAVPSTVCGVFNSLSPYEQPWARYIGVP